MITESDVYREHPGTTFAWALFASLFVNMVSWIIALWLVNVHLVLPQPRMQERDYQVSSSSITISKRVVPQPRRVQSAAPAPPRQQQQAQRVAYVPPRPLRNQGKPQQSERQSVRQSVRSENQIQTQFEQPAHAPISIATLPPRPPSVFRQSFSINLPGSEPDEFSGILSPVSSWSDGGLHCYYLHYIAQWSGGTSEAGNIPWPACYAPSRDPFPGEHRTHIPAPPPGYRLPEGATIGPWLRGLYEAWLHG